MVGYFQCEGMRSRPTENFNFVDNGHGGIGFKLFNQGCPSWIRTNIHCTKNSSPAIRRSGNCLKRTAKVKFDFLFTKIFQKESTFFSLFFDFQQVTLYFLSKFIFKRENISIFLLIFAFILIQIHEIFQTIFCFPSSFMFFFSFGTI